MRFAVAGVLALATAWPGAAQAPAPPPDFYAVVALAGFERPLEIRQSGLRRRVDVATDAIVQSFVSDRMRGALIVMTAAGRRRVALVFPLPGGEAGAPLPLELGLLGQAQRLTRIGSSTVAGRPCALWRYVGYLGHSGQVCATAEGLILELKPDGRPTPLFQVQSLTLGRQDPRWFGIPADYQIAALPGTGGLTPGQGQSPPR